LDNKHQQDERSGRASALFISSVSKSFGGVKAVQSVTLEIPVGERHALIGPNGAGKTTLFNLIAGELRIDRGRIEAFGEDITSTSIAGRARRGLARTFQISQLFLGLTVQQSLFLAGPGRRRSDRSFLKPWRSSAAELQFVQRVAEQVDLTGFLREIVKNLSHGLQRQLELGMALAMKPRLLMLDEPAAGLSPAERRTLTRLIAALSREVTMILIEHDIDIVLGVADRITVLNQGSIFAQDTPAMIRVNNDVQSIYLGSRHV
jgi:branched-chain amino acid transport system ATP-binding protein